MRSTAAPLLSPVLPNPRHPVALPLSSILAAAMNTPLLLYRFTVVALCCQLLGNSHGVMVWKKSWAKLRRSRRSVAALGAMGTVAMGSAMATETIVSPLLSVIQVSQFLSFIVIWLVLHFTL